MNLHLLIAPPGWSSARTCLDEDRLRHRRAPSLVVDGTAPFQAFVAPAAPNQLLGRGPLELSFHTSSSGHDHDRLSIFHLIAASP